MSLVMAKPAEYIYICTPGLQPKDPVSVWTKKAPTRGSTHGWRVLKYKLVDDTGDPTAKKKHARKHVVWCQEWVESEAGWGTRPDGFTLHLEKGSLGPYLKAMRAAEMEGKSPGYVPHEYIRPCGDMYPTEVDRATFLKLKKSTIRGVTGMMWTENPRERPAEWKGST